METFYSEAELKSLGLKRYGKNVKISRHAVIYRPEALEVGDNVRIDDFTTISGRVKLGSYIHIAQGCSLFGGSAGITMQDFSGLSSHVVIYATSDDYSGEFMTNPTIPEEYTSCIDLPVSLEKHVIVGCMSVILPGVTVPEGCALGSMSLCNKSLEPWGVYAGTPVRRLKARRKNLLDAEHQLINRRESRGKTIHELKIGDCVEKTDNVMYENAARFASITGDDNPIHFETQEACQSRYGKPIAHGMILAGFVSGAIGGLMPGFGCIYEAQQLSFVRPVFYGDKITTRITVAEIDVGRNRVALKTECFNQDCELVLDGMATVLPTKGSRK